MTHCKAKLAKSSRSGGRSSRCQEPSGHGICVLRVSLLNNTTTQLKWAHQRGCTISWLRCRVHSSKLEGKEAIVATSRDLNRKRQQCRLRRLYKQMVKSDSDCFSIYLQVMSRQEQKNIIELYFIINLTSNVCVGKFVKKAPTKMNTTCISLYTTVIYSAYL